MCMLCAFMNTSNSKTAGNPRKLPHQKHVRISVTIPPEIYAEGTRVLLKYKYSGYSDYLAARIRKDAGLDLAA